MWKKKKNFKLGDHTLSRVLPPSGPGGPFPRLFLQKLEHKNLLRILLRGSEPAGLGWAWAAAVLAIGNHLQSPTARFSKVPRASESQLQRSCTVSRCGIQKMQCRLAACLLYWLFKTRTEITFIFKTNKTQCGVGAQHSSVSLSFSLHTLGARVQTDLLVSSGCALPTHFPNRRPQLRVKQATSKRVHRKQVLHFKVSFILLLPWLGFFLLLLKVPQPDLLVSFKWQVLCTH